MPHVSLALTLPEADIARSPLLRAGGLTSGGSKQRLIAAIRAQRPNLNAVAERFVLSLKSECLDKLVPLGERHLRLAISEFIEHYHLERNHQGLDNRLIIPVAAPANDNADPAAPIARRERLGDLLSYYYRAAA